MSENPTTKSAAARAHYDQAAGSAPDFTVMNYGYHSAAEERSGQSAVPQEHPERYCLRLYEHAVQGVNLRGRNVLEVSCGRGGGAGFLARAFAPRRYVGLDLSEQNVRLARDHQREPNLEFTIGNAQALDFADAAFDVVINIEASHLYDDRNAFFREVFRVLRPGGDFRYVDGCWRDDDCSGELAAAGFELLERRDITENVLSALRLDSGRREAIVDAMPQVELRQQYKDWSGVIGYRAFQRFENGDTRYFSHRLRRSA
jgi:ubiquinone/menaquinone biosynthesis C-methylase UbiE